MYAIQHTFQNNNSSLYFRGRGSGSNLNLGVIKVIIIINNLKNIILKLLITIIILINKMYSKDCIMP